MQSYKLRIYYEDTDAQGVVYYANYLKFFERARTEFLRKAGYQQRALMEEGAIFVVRKVEISLLRPAKLDDEIVIQSSLVKLGKVTFDFKQEAFKEKELLCSGVVQCGCIDADKFSPHVLPVELYSGMKSLLG